MTILAYPNAESYIMQGITTVVVGNCGISMAPLNPKTADMLKVKRWQRYGERRTGPTHMKVS
jgi:N-acyl-D-aspartate/D-glutamate deacylase